MFPAVECGCRCAALTFDHSDPAATCYYQPFWNEGGAWGKVGDTSLPSGTGLTMQVSHTNVGTNDVGDFGVNV